MMRHQIVRALGALVALFALTNQCGSQDATRHKIGWLKIQNRTHAPEELKFLIYGLSERGQVEGTTFDIEARYADGDASKLQPLVDDLVHAGVDVIVATSQPVLEAAYSVTHTVSIVARMSDDPIKSGMARSLDSPGGNVTGLFSFYEERVSDRLAQLHQALPDLRKVGVLLTLDHGDSAYWLTQTRQTATKLGLDVYVMDVHAEADFDTVFAQARDHGVGGFLTFRSPVIEDFDRNIIELSNRYLIPGIFDKRDLVELGGFMSYGPDVQAAFRALAPFVDRILRGDKPGTLPIGQLQLFELAINLKSAKQLGLTVPPSFLTSADFIVR